VRLDEREMTIWDKFWLHVGETAIPFVLGVLCGMVVMWLALC
jgi:hypothetical protein